MANKNTRRNIDNIRSLAVRLRRESIDSEHRRQCLIADIGDLKSPEAVAIRRKIANQKSLGQFITNAREFLANK